MARRKEKTPAPRKRRPPLKAGAKKPRLRIIGGQFRGRRLLYHGDPGVRPMKDRVREAVFNLVGPAIRGTHAVDLFAGTGALGLEALSRGAAQATFIEQHVPTAEIIRRNIALLAVESVSKLVVGNVFSWLPGPVEQGGEPWVVFSSPPYDLYVQKTDAMLRLLGGLVTLSPAGSIFVVEADGRFNFAVLPEADRWKIRSYPPAVIGIYRKPLAPGGKAGGETAESVSRSFTHIGESHGR